MGTKDIKLAFHVRRSIAVNIQAFNPRHLEETFCKWRKRVLDMGQYRICAITFDDMNLALVLAGRVFIDERAGFLAARGNDFTDQLFERD